jgi:pSer/pThr/pTyr-binding forkhead associated (FHA) protein
MNERVTLTVKDGMLAGKHFAFCEPRVYRIGRAEECELHLPSGFEFCTVSRRHCQVEVSESGVRLRDLGSKNGTFVNGLRIGRPAGAAEAFQELSRPPADFELRDGDELRVADVTFLVEVASTHQDGDWSTAEEHNAFALHQPCLN